MGSKTRSAKQYGPIFQGIRLYNTFRFQVFDIGKQRSDEKSSEFFRSALKELFLDDVE